MQLLLWWSSGEHCAGCVIIVVCFLSFSFAIPSTCIMAKLKFGKIIRQPEYVPLSPCASVSPSLPPAPPLQLPPPFPPPHFARSTITQGMWAQYPGNCIKQTSWGFARSRPNLQFLVCFAKEGIRRARPVKRLIRIASLKLVHLGKLF